MVEWAKTIHPFPDLSMEDKIILLKNYAPQHLILMPAFRLDNYVSLIISIKELAEEIHYQNSKLRKS